jgi:hypothetical protein
MNYDELMKLSPEYQNSPEDMCPIKIMSGEFEGIVYQLGKLRFEEEDKLSFEMEVLDGKIPDGKDEEFNDLIGKYIIHLLMEQIRRDNEKIEGDSQGSES